MAEDWDLRAIWNKGKELEKTQTFDFDRLDKSGTKTTLYWIKLILRIEFWINVVALPAVLYFLLEIEQNKWFAIAYGIIAVGYFFYYSFLIKQVRIFNYDGNVLVSLKKIYSYLNFFLLHYKVLIGISLLLGIIYAYFDEVKAEDNPIESSEDLIRFWVFLLIYSLVTGFVMNFLINLIYGRKIKRIRKTVKALENESFPEKSNIG